MSKIVEIVKKQHASNADTGPCTFTRYENGTNGKYLENVLGCWPLRMIWNQKKGQEDRWIFTAIGDEDEYRFVIMPMRG